jgi:hypothetical protein
MSRDNPIKHFAFAFLIALAIYYVAYTSIEHRRNRKGPWQVTFTNSPSGEAQILINQPALRLTNAGIVFSGAFTNYSATLEFRQPREVPYPLPFGRCVFMDPTFLPGTLTFQLFGHEVELLPRVMVIDHKEQPWASGTTLRLPKVEDKK